MLKKHLLSSMLNFLKSLLYIFSRILDEYKNQKEKKNNGIRLFLLLLVSASNEYLIIHTHLAYFCI